MFFFNLTLSPAICLTIARRSGWVGWLAGCCRQCRRSCSVFFFFRLAFPSRSPAIFLLSPWSVVVNSSDLQRREKESLNGNTRKKRYEPSGSFRLLYRRFNVSAVVKERQTMSSVSHLSLLSLSGILSYLVWYLQRYITTHTRTRKRRKRQKKTFRVVLSRGPKSSKYIDSSPCLRFLLRYNSCCLRICRARINPCVSLRPMLRYYKPV